MLFQSRLPMRLRVTPHPASSGFAGDRSSSCLDSRVLQHIRWRSSGHPALQSFGCACRCVPPGCPFVTHLPALPAIDLRVAPNLASFSTSDAVAWGFPRSYALPVVPADVSTGLPRLLHLPAVPAMESRVASLLASFGASGAYASGCPSASLLQLRLLVWWRVSPRLHLPALPQV
jgi:hypothetical protein